MRKLQQRTRDPAIPDACSQTSQVRGRSAIAKVIIDQLRDGRSYVGAPRLVTQSGQLALIISDAATSVARRSLHGWRYVISRLDL